MSGIFSFDDIANEAEDQQDPASLRFADIAAEAEGQLVLGPAAQPRAGGPGYIDNRLRWNRQQPDAAAAQVITPRGPVAPKDLPESPIYGAAARVAAQQALRARPGQPEMRAAEEPEVYERTRGTGELLPDLVAGFRSGQAETIDLLAGAPARALGLDAFGENIRTLVRQRQRGLNNPGRGIGHTIGSGLATTFPSLAAGVVAGPPAVVASSYAMGVGDVQQNMEEAGTADGVTPFLVAPSYALLESIFPTNLLERLGGGSLVHQAVQQGYKGVLGRVGLEAAHSAIEEGSTEALQSLLTYYSARYPADQATDLGVAGAQAAQEGLAGAMVGGLIGAGGAAVNEGVSAVDEALSRRTTQPAHVARGAEAQLFSQMVAGVPVDPVMADAPAQTEMPGVLTPEPEPVAAPASAPANMEQPPRRRLTDLSPAELVDTQLPPEYQTSRGTYDGPERRRPPQVDASPSELVDRLPKEMQTSRGTFEEVAEEAEGRINPESRYAEDENPEALLAGAEAQARGHRQRWLAAQHASTSANGKRLKALQDEMAMATHLWEGTLQEIEAAFGHETAEQVRLKVLQETGPDGSVTPPAKPEKKAKAPQQREEIDDDLMRRRLQKQADAAGIEVRAEGMAPGEPETVLASDPEVRLSLLRDEDVSEMVGMARRIGEDRQRKPHLYPPGSEAAAEADLAAQDFPLLAAEYARRGLGGQPAPAPTEDAGPKVTWKEAAIIPTRGGVKAVPLNDDESILDALEAPPAPDTRDRSQDHFPGADTDEMTMAARKAIIDQLQEGPEDRHMLEQLSHEELAKLARDEGLFDAVEEDDTVEALPPNDPTQPIRFEDLPAWEQEEITTERTTKEFRGKSLADVDAALAEEGERRRADQMAPGRWQKDFKPTFDQGRWKGLRAVEQSHLYRKAQELGLTNVTERAKRIGAPDPATAMDEAIVSLTQPLMPAAVRILMQQGHLTDADILEVIKGEHNFAMSGGGWGTGGGGGDNGWYVDHRPGKITISRDGGTKHKIEGAKLVKRVRALFNIPGPPKGESVKGSEAQKAEQPTPNRQGAGSTPAGPATGGEAEARPEVIRGYHGTGATFDRFKVPAFFFENKADADTYAAERGQGRGRTITADLRLTKVATQADVEAAAKRVGVYDESVPTYQYLSPAMGDAAGKVLPLLKEQGFDAARIPDFTFGDDFTEVESVVVLDPQAITIQPNQEAAGGSDVRPAVSGDTESAAPADVSGAQEQRDAETARPAAGEPGDGPVSDDAGAAAREGARPEGPDRAEPAPAEPGEPGAGSGRERPARAAGGPAGSLPAGSNYRLTDADQIGAGGPREKLRANLAAIRLLKQIEGEGRPATRDEQAILAKYVGWGGLSQAFEEGHKDYNSELRDLLTDEEYRAARASTPNAHYTSPTVIHGMAEALSGFGVTRARALEPSMGAGNFLGFLDPALVRQWTGVELDSVTGRIGRLLYPQADVRISGFQDVKIPEGTYDVAVGNPPFGNVKLHDPKYNKLKLSIHNYFFAKALDSVRPGGIVAFVTSRYTLDEQSPAFRRWLAERSTFLGAIRLPAGSFRQNAGTEVVTDIIFLQKNAEGAAGNPDQAFVESVSTPIDGEPAHTNAYYLAHPQMSFGRHELTRGMHRANEPTWVLPKDADFQQLFSNAIRLLPKGVYQPKSAAEVAAEAAAQRMPAPAEVREGNLTEVGGVIHQRVNGELVPLAIPKTQVPKVRALIQMRGAIREVLNVQAAGGSDAQVKASQKALAALYDPFVKAHGPVNQETRTTVTRKNKDGEPQESVQVRYPNLAPFMDDADWTLLAMLERHDEDAGTYTKADIFTERLIAPPERVESVATPDRALPVVLAELGRVDLARIAQLTGLSETDVPQALRGLIYRNPEGGEWEAADHYLTGNVRAKLAVAQEAAKKDPALKANVEALEKVQPADLPPSQISARLGAPWIPAADVEAFAREMFDGAVSVSTNRAGEALWSWKVEADWRAQTSTGSTITYGTDKVSGPEILEATLNGKAVEVTKPSPEGRVKDLEATLAAQDKQQALKDRFATWLWEHPPRAGRLVRKYNDEQNNIRLPKPDGSHLTFPGMAGAVRGKPFHLRPHQKDAIWRILQEGNTLLAHIVGAGKTFTMVAASMEAKRLGLARKPLHVIPNHMLLQYSREFRELYPGAQLLVATKEDFAKDRRKAFTAKMAGHNWDAIIMTHRSFEAIKMSLDFQQAVIQQEQDALRAAILMAREQKGKSRNSSVKQIETAMAKRQERIEKLLAEGKKDDLLSFEELGVDMLFVDEAHLFKNLNITTRKEGLGSAGSERSFDLFLKAKYLDQRTPGRGLVFATGTPIANSVAEMYTMQRYLQPRLLAERGLENFDAWAATFGEDVTGLEITPDGAGYRLKTRFARFVNMGELAQMFRLVADVQMDPDALGLKRPTLLGGQMRTIAVPATAQQRAYVQSLVRRLERIKAKKVAPEEDNNLKVTSDGRHMALDGRLVGTGPGEKLETAAQRIFDTWERHHAVRGAQLVFSDIGVNPRLGGEEGFSAYAELRRLLLAKGIPANEIAFMQAADTDEKKAKLFQAVREGRIRVQAADTDEKKAKLFQAVREGRIRVLVGSTEKMGAGTNVQDRLVAEHHLDAPWRPADIEQRNGRILRQGNVLFNEGKIPGVEINAYVTEGSFDAYIWQGLERKAGFIVQALTADASTRDIEDIGTVEVDYATSKALASGNPLVMEKAGIDAEVAKLQRAKAAHTDQLFRAQQEMAALPGRVAALTAHEAALQKDLDRRQDTSGEAFTIRVGDQTYTTRKEAAAALLAEVEKYRQYQGLAGASATPRLLGEFAGFPFSLVSVPRALDQTIDTALELHGQSAYRRTLDADASQGSILATLEALPQRIERELAAATKERETWERKRETLSQQVDQPWDKAKRLEEALAKQTELNAKLKEAEKQPAAGPTPEMEDVTNRSIADALGDTLENEEGFLRLWKSAEVENPEGPRVLADPLARKVGVAESLIIPPSRVAQRLKRERRESSQAIGGTIEALVGQGREATLAYHRHINEFQERTRRLLLDLSKAEQAELVRLADTVEDVASLPEGTSDRLKERFQQWREAAREDWRQLGMNEYRMLTSKQSQAAVRQALAVFEEGPVTPDYAGTPVNREDIEAALAKAQRKGRVPAALSPAMGWERLVNALKEAKVRVQKPRYLTSPDLQRIVDMIQGRGGIMTYFPHVFQGEWVVKAGAHTARFVDRNEAIRYARRLLEEGKWTEDLLVRRDAFLPYDGQYISRAHYDRMKRSLEAALDADAITVGRALREDGKIKARPRKRRFAHLQKREVNLQTFNKEIRQALGIYHFRLARKLAFDPFRKTAIDLAETLPLEGGWREYGLDYVAGVEGVPHTWVERVNASLEALFGGRLGPFALQRGASTWQAVMSWWHLGWSPVTALVNLTQLAINVVPRLGPDGHAWLLKGIRAYAQGDPESKRVLDTLGIQLQHPKYFLGEHVPSWMQVRQDAWYMPMGLFNATEDLNRSGAALAKYYQERAAGKDERAATAAARDFVYDTNFDYSNADAATVFRDPVGKAFLQFKNFAINQVFFAYDLLRHGTPQQRATFLGYMMALGGLNVLARATPLFIVNWLLGLTGWWKDERDEDSTPWDALWRAVGNVADSKMLSAAKYGLLAALGLNLSERIGFGGPQEFTLGRTLPESKLKDLGAMLGGKDPTQRAAAMRRLLPAVVRRLLNARDAATAGVTRDRYGRIIDDQVNAGKVAAIALGTPTVEQSEGYEQRARQQKMEDDYKAERADLLDRMASAMRARDLAAFREAQREALERGIHISIQSVREYLKRREQGPAEREYRGLPKDLRRIVPRPEVK